LFSLYYGVVSSAEVIQLRDGGGGMALNYESGEIREETIVGV
jgi:hypothetical protein